MIKNTDHFDQSFLDEIKEKLLAEKTDLEKEVKEITGDFPDYGNEVDDDVQEVEAFTVNKAINITLEKKLRDVLAALKRLEDGTYGICKYTGEPIDKRRLLARPTSTASVEAKKLLTDEA